MNPVHVNASENRTEILEIELNHRQKPSLCTCRTAYLCVKQMPSCLVWKLLGCLIWMSCAQKYTDASGSVQWQ